MNEKDAIARWDSLYSWAKTKIKDQALRDIIAFICAKDSFKSCPAATKYHHAFESGLLVHVSEMLVLAQKAMEDELYSHIDWEVVIASIIMHDCGKVMGYTKTSTGVIYNDRNKKMGHLCMSFAEFISLAKKYHLGEKLATEIGHCLLAHHGRQEWGSPVEPLTPEAWFVHLADMISSRCTQFRNELDPFRK